MVDLGFEIVIKLICVYVGVHTFIAFLALLSSVTASMKFPELAPPPKEKKHWTT